MKRTFDLVNNRLGMPNTFIPYIRSNENNFSCYNDIAVKKINNPLPADDYFRMSISNGGNIPDEYIASGSDQMWDTALDPLRQLFVDFPFNEAFKKLMEYDTYSVRTYLTQKLRYPTDVVNWFETVESRTGLMDASLTETVLASLVFIDPRFKSRKIDWFCLEYALSLLVFFGTSLTHVLVVAPK